MNSVMLLSTDRELGKVLKEALLGTPAKVSVECSTVRDAMDSLAQSPVPLVVVDLFIPESSGLEALKQLKRINEKCMFLLLARMRTRAVVERAFRLGAHDVIEYPASTEMLRDSILHRLEAEPLHEEEEKPEAEQARKK